MTPDDALGIVQRVVERARPGEQLEAVCSFVESTEVRAHGGEVEHFVAAEEVGVGVRVIDAGRTGISWAGVMDEESLSTCVEEARDNARFATADPHAGLAEPDGVPFTAIDTVDDQLAEVDPRDKVGFAMDLDARIGGADMRIVGHEGADYADARSVTALCSTAGVRAAQEETIAHAGIWAMASDGDEVTTGFGVTFGRGFDMLDPDEVIDEAVARCTAMFGARKADSARLTVVLDPYVTSQLLGVVAEMFSGESVVRGRTPFADRVGELIASPLVHLRDDPLDASSVTAVPVDGEGLATRKVPLIEDGRLTGFLHNAYTARCLGTRSTGSAVRSGHRSGPVVGPSSLIPEPGRTSPAQIIGGIQEGLFVREVSGLHSGVNPISGDVSVGVEGTLIRDGELAEPVKEVTIGSTVQRMLVDVVAVGADLRRFPWESAGVTLAISDVMMSGN